MTVRIVARGGGKGGGAGAGEDAIYTERNKRDSRIWLVFPQPLRISR